MNMVIELLSAVMGFMYLVKIMYKETNPKYSEACLTVMHLTDHEIENSKHGFFYMTDNGHLFSYQILISGNIVLYTVYTIL